jgi:hypothetical protein
VAEVERDTPPTVRPVTGRRPRLRYDEDVRHEPDPDESRFTPRIREPHRGAAILTLGILSLVFSCFPLGIVAWVMGNTDLDAIRRGRMDPSGEGLTQAGRICGIISTIPVMIAGIALVIGALAAVVSSVGF